MTTDAGTDALGVVLSTAESVFAVPVTGDDDFFSLGGDSLVAVQFANALEEALRIPVDLDDVFDAECFADLAQHLAVVRGDAG